eukprot:UN14624
MANNNPYKLQFLEDFDDLFSNKSEEVWNNIINVMNVVCKTMLEKTWRAEDVKNPGYVIMGWDVMIP